MTQRNHVPPAESRPPASRSRDLLALEENVGKALRGKSEVVRLAIVALLSRGHLLVEDVPGVGKTTLAAALARSLGCGFQRIQFTADLLPSDLIGVNIWNPERHAFEFHKGPVFSPIVLADEINRATPKTQSSLLEAMSEGTVTVDGTTYPLPDPFFVIATQNPTEHFGAFPLPDSQLDRFQMRIRIGYPGLEAEREILEAHRYERPLATLAPVLDPPRLVALQGRVRSVHVDAAISSYLLAIVARTRDREGVTVGVSPRGSLDLYRAAQARALLLGREYCLPDDVKEMAVPVLAHRMQVRGVATGNRAGHAEQIVGDLLAEVPVPL